MASIVFENVTKAFGDTLAVDNVSFEIKDNEFFCFFGPPLSGKTTILRLMLGLDSPDSGDIYIGGQKVTQLGAAERNMAMVFQNLALFPHMTALDNIRFPLVERRIPESQIRTKVEEASDKLHIKHILHKPPAQLSGGERQRVAIARALVRDPVAYLMDDPISALDARLREETRVELKRIQREIGHTLVYVTHDQEEAMSVADRMAILKDGHVEQIGTPIEIYDQPANSYVAALLGAPRINLFNIEARDKILTAGDGLLDLQSENVPVGTKRIGLRPENLKIRDRSDRDQGEPAQVVSVEPLGGFTVVSVARKENANEVFRAMLRGQPQIDVGTDVALGWDPSSMLFFDEGDRAISI